MSPFRPFLLPQPRVSPRAPLPTHHSPRLRHPYSRLSPPQCLSVSVANPMFSVFCGLFVSSKKVNSFGIKQIQTLFRKHPGWGVPPAASFGVFRLTPSRPITSFRINTCKSVTKQTTLTIFRMNTYKKQGEGGASPSPPQGCSQRSRARLKPAATQLKRAARWGAFRVNGVPRREAGT